MPHLWASHSILFAGLSLPGLFERVQLNLRDWQKCVENLSDKIFHGPKQHFRGIHEQRRTIEKLGNAHTGTARP